MLNKKILFITGTRADFGKISPLISKLQDDEEFDFHIFVTGMHLLEKYSKGPLDFYLLRVAQPNEIKNQAL